MKRALILALLLCSVSFASAQVFGNPFVCLQQNLDPVCTQACDAQFAADLEACNGDAACEMIATQDWQRCNMTCFDFQGYLDCIFGN